MSPDGQNITGESRTLNSDASHVDGDQLIVSTELQRQYEYSLSTSFPPKAQRRSSLPQPQRRLFNKRLASVIIIDGAACTPWQGGQNQKLQRGRHAAWNRSVYGSSSHAFCGYRAARIDRGFAIVITVKQLHEQMSHKRRNIIESWSNHDSSARMGGEILAHAIRIVALFSKKCTITYVHISRLFS